MCIYTYIRHVGGAASRAANQGAARSVCRWTAWRLRKRTVFVVYIDIDTTNKHIIYIYIYIYAHLYIHMYIYIYTHIHYYYYYYYYYYTPYGGTV